MTKLVFVGGGGHAKVLIELVKSLAIYEIVGILDPVLEIGEKVCGVPVLGSDDMLRNLYGREVVNACIGVGSTKSNDNRRRLFENLLQNGFAMPAFVHNKAVVSPSVVVSDGVQIMAGAIVQPGSRLGKNTIINTAAVVDHDCSIGSHVHVCPGAVVSGDCIIADGAFIGAGATLINGVKVGKNSVVGAGAVVLKDVPDDALVKGVPAK
ncbi:MAG: acetyltransferase [Nitrospirae bacterium]|nr:acetyltransferase [Nitrospirota bacterium]